MARQTLTIGELSRHSGVPVKTLRFWSDEGLLPPATRSRNGYRLYGEDATIRVDLVRTLRDAGLGPGAPDRARLRSGDRRRQRQTQRGVEGRTKEREGTRAPRHRLARNFREQTPSCPNRPAQGFGPRGLGSARDLA
jgi:DNA-binding transcriptional MerR regulator